MFGEQLKKARINKGYTLEQLADTYNQIFDGKLSKGTLSKYENNKQEPMISVVNNLSSILGVSTDFLLAKEDEMDLLNERIKSRRLELGLTLAELAEKIGVRDATIQRYESGEIKNIKRSTVVKLAEALKTTPAYLMGWDTPSSDTVDVTKLKNYVPYNPVKVPFLGEIACGEPIYANQEYDSYVITDEGIHADFCIRAKGDSMINAGIDDGDIVFIRRQSYIDNGSIAAVAIDDTVTLKRFYQSDTTVTLVAENPAYAPIIHDFTDGKSIYILGKAVAVQKPLTPAGHKDLGPENKNINSLK